MVFCVSSSKSTLTTDWTTLESSIIGSQSFDTNLLVDSLSLPEKVNSSTRYLILDSVSNGQV